MSHGGARKGSGRKPRKTPNETPRVREKQVPVRFDTWVIIDTLSKQTGKTKINLMKEAVDQFFEKWRQS